MLKSRWHSLGKPPDLLHSPWRPKPCQDMPTSVPGWFLQLVAAANSSFPLRPWSWLFFVPTDILAVFCRFWPTSMPAQWLFGPQGWVGLKLWGICCCPRPKWAPKAQHAKVWHGCQNAIFLILGRGGSYMQQCMPCQQLKYDVIM